MKKTIALLCAVFLLAACLAGCKDAAQKEESHGQDENHTQNETPVQPRTYIALQGFDGKLGILYNDTCILTDYKYDYSIPVCYSLDGNRAVLLTNEGALLYVHDSSVEKIVDYPASYRFSASGNAIAFRIEEENEAASGLECGLYLYHATTGQTEQVVTDTQCYARSYTLSPDGQTLAYVSTASVWDSIDARLMIHREGTSTLRMAFEKDAAYLRVLVYDLISINDSADIIYLHDKGRMISVNQEGTMKRLPTTDLGSIFYCNADHSQLLYLDAGSTYLSSQGQRGVLLCEDWMYPVEPGYIQFHQDTYHPGQQLGATYAVTCDFADLNGQVMHSDSGLITYWYPNESGEYVQLASYAVLNEEEYWLDPSGTYLCYMDGELHCLDLKNGTNTLLVSKLAAYAVSPDCSTVYYYYDGLSRCSGTAASEPEKVPLDGNMWQIYFSENNQVFFACSDGTYRDLYTISKDGEPSVLLQNLVLLTQYENGMIFLSTGERGDATQSNRYYIIRAGELLELKMQEMNK